MDKDLKKLEILITVLDRKFKNLNIHDARWAGFMAASKTGQLPDKAIMRATECLIDHEFAKKAADLLFICCDMIPKSGSLLDYTVKVMRQIGMEKEALSYLKKRLKHQPEDWIATKLLGRLYFHQGKRDKGYELVEGYLDQHPDHIPALTEKATLLLTKGGEEVETVLTQMLKLEPDNLFALSQVAQNRSQSHDIKAAEEAIAKMREYHSEDAMLPYCEAFLADQQLDFEKALVDYNRALELNPRFIEAYGKSGGILAKLGRDLPEAWYRLEARLPQLMNKPDGPFWRGEDLIGKSLFIWAEQGIADQLSFATMFRDLPQGLDKVFVETEPKMVSLFQRTFPHFHVFARGAKRPQDYDYHTPMGSLTNFLRPDMDSFTTTPVQPSVVDTGQEAKWQDWLNQLPEGKKIGLCWRSGAKSLVRTRDGLSLIEDLKDLLTQDGLVFVNCHYADVQEELDAVATDLGVTIHNPPQLDQFDDVDQTAALIKSLDAFVGIATTPTRVAQSLGTPTYMLYFGEPGQVERHWWPETKFYCRRPEDVDWGKQITAVIQSVNS